MKRKAFLALAMSVGLAMNAGQAGAVVANPGVAAKAANGQETGPIAKAGWRGYGPGWHGGWRHGHYWRPGYGWAPFAALGAALAATGAYYYATGPYYYDPYYYGPRP